ncbi:MAG: NosD domain-containing protein [Thermodesulfobacteriota bacterium]|nr:NosD domain-containing protein [Thermodesulfobacteriota bacterium]
MRLKILLIAFLISLIPSMCSSAVTYFVTSPGSGDKNGSDWANAMDEAQFRAALSGATSAAGTMYFLGGDTTYTLGGAWGDNTIDGTVLEPIIIAGVTPLVAEPWPNNLCSGTSRPEILAGANNFRLDLNWHIYGLQIETTDTEGLDLDSGQISGCSIYNSSGVAGRYAIYAFSAETYIFDNDLRSTNGFGANIRTNSTFIFNYIHDSRDGIYVTLYTNLIGFNVFDTITEEAILAVENTLTIIYNTIYNANEGIQIDEDEQFIIIRNNIIDNCTSGIVGEAGKPGYNIIMDYNNYSNNVSDTVNISKGPNATSYDPQFTDAAGGDFSPDAESGVTSAAEVMKIPYGMGEQ